MDKWNLKRPVALAIIAIPAFLIGLLYVSSGGLHWLDIVDKYVNSYGLVAVGLAECIAVGWFIGPEKLRKHVNVLSEVRIGKWFDFLVKYFTPLILIILLVYGLVGDIKVPYEGYPQWALNIGWIMVILLPIIAYVFSKLKTAKEVDEFKVEE